MTINNNEEIHNLFKDFLNIYNSNSEYGKNDNIENITIAKSFEDELEIYIKNLHNADGLNAFELVHNLTLLPMVSIEETGEIIVYNEKLGVWEFKKEGNFVSEKVVVLILTIIKNHNAKLSHASKAIKHSLFVKEFINQVRFKKVIPKSVLNSEETKICVKNGVVDLKNKRLMPFDKDFYFTERLDFDYNPNSKSELFNKSIGIFDSSEIGFIQSIAGQGLIGKQTSVRVHLFYGSGANGKSVFLSLLYSTSPSSDVGHNEMFTKSRDNFQMGVFEKRTLIVEELPEKELDMTSVKTALGTNKIAIREMYQNARTITPISTIYATSNHLPETRNFDAGSMRRIIIIPINKTFTILNTKESLFTEDKRMDYAHSDTSVLEAFLSWRIDGAYRFLKNGEDEVPQSIEEFTSEWRKNNQENNTPVYSFIQERIANSDEHFIFLQTAYSIFREFCEESGLTPISRIKFRKEIERITGKESTQNRPNGLILSGTPKKLSDTSRKFKGLKII